MSTLYGKPSAYLFKKDLKYFIIARLPIILGIVFFYIFLINLNYFASKGLKFMFIIVLAFILVLKILDIIIDIFLKKSGQYHHGREGERDIYKELKKLPDDYLVFRNIKLPNIDNDLDFIVICSTGVYTIETKSHKGNIGYDGQQLTRDGKIFEKDFLKQAMFETMSFKEFIKEKTGKDIYVNSVLVFSSPCASLRFGFRPIKNVMVLGKNFLDEYFNQQQMRLNNLEINIIKDAIMTLVK